MAVPDQDQYIIYLSHILSVTVANSRLNGKSIGTRISCWNTFFGYLASLQKQVLNSFLSYLPLYQTVLNGFFFLEFFSSHILNPS